jgi:hypothetical protein
MNAISPAPVQPQPGVDPLRAVAAELEARGFETCPLDLAPTGEPTAVHVCNPVTRAYAEVHADDGGLELRCWSPPHDPGGDGVVARAIRLLTTSAADHPPAPPTRGPRTAQRPTEFSSVHHPAFRKEGDPDANAAR